MTLSDHLREIASNHLKTRHAPEGFGSIRKSGVELNAHRMLQTVAAKDG